MATPRPGTHIPLALLCAALARGSLAQDWPQFRGPGGQGQSQEPGLPATWNSAENVVWKTELPGAGASSPIVLGDKVFVTCYSGYGVEGVAAGTMEDLRLHLVCVGRADGKIVWDRAVAPKLPETPQVRDHGYAASTPVTDGHDLYVFFGKTGVFKFDLAGRQQWNVGVGSKLNGWGSAASPILSGDLVIVNASVESGALVALAKADGKEAWRVPGMDQAWSTPHLVSLPDGKQELVMSVKNRLFGFDPATGAQLWQCQGVQDYVCPSLVSQDGIVYALGGRKSQAMAVRAGGRGDVTATHRLWSADVGANVSSPVISDGHLYWVSDRNNTAYCLKLIDGAVVYSQKVEAHPYASVVLGDGKLFVVSRRGGTLVLAAKPAFEKLAYNTLDDTTSFDGSPAVAGGRLFLRSNRCLYALGLR